MASFMSLSLYWIALLAVLLEFSEDHRKDQQGALGKQLIEGRDRGQDHAIVQDPDHGHPEQRTDDTALASLHGTATKEGSRDGLKFQPLRAGNRLARPGAGCQQDAANPRHSATHDERADAVAIEVDPGEAGNDRVAANGIEIPADDGLGQEDVEHHRRHDQHPDWHWDAKKPANTDCPEGVVEDRNRLPVGNDEGNPAEDRHGAEGHNDVVDAAIGDDDTVEEACEPADNNAEHDPQKGRTRDLDRRSDSNRGQTNNRANGDIHASRNHHRGLRNSQNPEDGDAHAHVQNVAHGEEDIPAQGAEQDEECQKGQDQTDVVDPDAADCRFVEGLARICAVCVERFFSHFSVSRSGDHGC